MTTSPSGRDDVRDLLDHAASMQPGVFMMFTLGSMDRGRLSDDDAVLFLQLHQRVTSWWTGVAMDATVAAVTAEATVDQYVIFDRLSDEERSIRITDARREELSAALRQSPSLTQTQMDVARLLDGPLADTRSLLDRGLITERHVTVIVNQARRLPGFWMRDIQEVDVFTSACTELQRRVLPVAQRGSLVQTRSAAARAIRAIDPEGHDRRRRQALAERDVWVSHELDGTSLLMARLATEHALAALGQIDALAKGNESPASMGERRAGALLGLVLGGDGSSATSMSAQVNVTIDLPTLLGLQDSGAELTGVGAVTAQVVRDLLADPRCTVSLRRLVTEPVTGEVLDVGRSAYRIPDRLRELILARDVTCRFPGCSRRARLEIDHATPWDEGGPTTRANLGALCTRHHQLKTHGGWRITESHPDGRCRWQSPDGRTYEHGPSG